jgi:hypothetical protein
VTRVYNAGESQYCHYTHTNAHIGSVLQILTQGVRDALPISDHAPPSPQWCYQWSHPAPLPTTNTQTKCNGCTISDWQLCNSWSPSWFQSCFF